jgi:protein-S-isoprenylcysteine O-methyltransferase Ste14
VTPPPSAAARTAVTVAGALWFALVFFVALPAAVLWWSGSGLVPPPGWNRPLGAALLIAAHALLLPALVAFVRDGRGTQVPALPPRRLVASGGYTRIRNPMYALYVAIAASEAVLYRSLPLGAYAVALFALAHAYVVGVEERGLRRRFGAEYDAYCARVGRWLPRRRGAA